MHNRIRIRFCHILALIMAFTLILAGCGASNQTAAEPETGNDGAGSAESAATHPLLNKRIALIMQLNLGTFSAQYIEGVKNQVEAFGGTLTVFTAEGDLAKMASHLDAAINQRFDGILIDHGTAEA